MDGVADADAPTPWLDSVYVCVLYDFDRVGQNEICPCRSSHKGALFYVRIAGRNTGRKGTYINQTGD